MSKNNLLMEGTSPSLPQQPNFGSFEELVEIQTILKIPFN